METFKMLLVYAAFAMCVYGLFTQTFELTEEAKSYYNFTNVKAAFLEERQ